MFRLLRLDDLLLEKLLVILIFFSGVVGLKVTRFLKRLIVHFMRLNFLLVVRCSVFFASCSLSFARYFLLDARYFLLVARYFFVQITVK